MIYFKETEDKYLDKPFVIYDPNVACDIKKGVSPDSAFYYRHLKLLRKINMINNHLSMIGLNERIKRLFDWDCKNDEYFKLDNEIRSLALTLPFQRVKELIKMYDELDHSSPESKIKALAITREMMEQIKTFPENGLDYVDSNSLAFLFFDYDDSSEWAYIEEIFKKPKWTHYETKRVLYFYRNLFELVNFTSDNIIEEIDKALEDLEKNYTAILHIPKDENRPDYESFAVPDAWYILPGINGFEDTLYNTTGAAGHKETTLEYLSDHIFYGGMICTEWMIEDEFRQLFRLAATPFVDASAYQVDIKCGYCGRHLMNILLPNGDIYGLRGHSLDFIRYERIKALENLPSLIPDDKKAEYYSFLNERSKYFHILDKNGLPMGYIDVINKSFELVEDERFHETPSGICIPDIHLLMGIKMELDYFAENFKEEKCSYDPKDYEWMSPVIFNNMARTLYLGYRYARLLFMNFFKNLYKYSNDYKKALEYLKHESMDSLFIRACGFSKFTRQINGRDSYRVIVTSNPNYLEEFKEYMDKGWNIEYLPPITINKETGELIDELKSSSDIEVKLCTHELIKRFSNLNERYEQKS